MRDSIPAEINYGRFIVDKAGCRNIIGTKNPPFQLSFRNLHRLTIYGLIDYYNSSGLPIETGGSLFCYFKIRPES